MATASIKYVFNCSASSGASELNVLYLTPDTVLFFGVCVGNNRCVLNQQFRRENFTHRAGPQLISSPLVKGSDASAAALGAAVVSTRL